jgi:hypothetical protein
MTINRFQTGNNWSAGGSLATIVGTVSSDLVETADVPTGMRPVIDNFELHVFRALEEARSVTFQFGSGSDSISWTSQGYARRGILDLGQAAPKTDAHIKGWAFNPDTGLTLGITYTAVSVAGVLVQGHFEDDPGPGLVAATFPSVNAIYRGNRFITPVGADDDGLFRVIAVAPTGWVPVLDEFLVQSDFAEVGSGQTLISSNDTIATTEIALFQWGDQEDTVDEGRNPNPRIYRPAGLRGPLSNAQPTSLRATFTGVTTANLISAVALGHFESL